MHTVLNVLKIQCRSWLASDSVGSANINFSKAAAIAASPRLDSSHLDLQGLEDCISLPPQDAHGTQCTTIQCRSWLASDSGGSANIHSSNAAAIAASPRLDSSYIDLQGLEDCISLPPQDAYGTQCTTIQCRSWLASDSGGSASINPSNAAAIAASPRLDSSHLDLQGLEDCISLPPQDAHGTQCTEDPM
ncbi:hypothetical protein HBO11_04735 [Pseudomonas sp. WS 5010]|jgi:hypothetical protein|uniref:hypothetical protein n=1 Tax=Pseudomonas sp. WS 5010 TaxID=2717489 RepID=UPI0014728B8D|nr:hypothetical protein [Pseudomonas sp. WS 5010]NMX84854.1 hypothetical protein [Pseudomonas sp. WS 5010]